MASDMASDIAIAIATSAIPTRCQRRILRRARLQGVPMRQLTTDYLQALRSSREPPCISLYQPTHRHHPDNQQDPIRYRNLRRDMENSLREKYPARDIRALIDKYQAPVLDRKSVV